MAYTVQYYVYTPDGKPENASGVVRATLRNGSTVNTHRLKQGEWVEDRECYGDILGVTGTTRMRKVSKSQLRDILSKNSSSLDADEVLTFSKA